MTPRFLVLAALSGIPAGLAAQPALPLRQSALDWSARDPGFRIELDSTFDGRWLGGGATLPRWGRGGALGLLQYALEPKPIVAGNADDPWWRVSRDGRRLEPVDRKDALMIPTAVDYTRDGGGRCISIGASYATGSVVCRPGSCSSGPMTWSRSGAPTRKEVWYLSAGDLWALDRRAAHCVSSPGLRAARSAQGQQGGGSAAHRATGHLRLRQTQAAPTATPPKPAGSATRTAADRDSEKNGRHDQPAHPLRDRRLCHVPGHPAGGNDPDFYGDYVNDSGFVFTRSPSQGRSDAAHVKLGIVKADPSPSRQRQGDLAGYDGFGKPVSVMQVSWNRQGTRLAADVLSPDYKDRWIVLVTRRPARRNAPSSTCTMSVAGSLLDRHAHAGGLVARRRDPGLYQRSLGLAPPLGGHRLGVKRQHRRRMGSPRGALSRDQSRWWMETSERIRASGISTPCRPPGGR